MKRKDLLKKVERIVCSECSESNKTLLHRNGTYICKDCFKKMQEPEVIDTPEKLARKNEIRETISQATLEKQKESKNE